MTFQLVLTDIRRLAPMLAGALNRAVADLDSEEKTYLPHVRRVEITVDHEGRPVLEFALGHGDPAAEAFAHQVGNFLVGAPDKEVHRYQLALDVPGRRIVITNPPAAK